MQEDAPTFDERIGEFHTQWGDRSTDEKFLDGQYPVDTFEGFIQFRTDVIGLLYKELDIDPEPEEFLSEKSLPVAFYEWIKTEARALDNDQVNELLERFHSTDKFLREWVDPQTVPHTLR